MLFIQMLDRIDILMLMLILQSFLQIPFSIDAGLAAASLSLSLSPFQRSLLVYLVPPKGKALKSCLIRLYFFIFLV